MTANTELSVAGSHLALWRTMNSVLSWVCTGALFLIPIRLFLTHRLPAALFYAYMIILLLIAIILPVIFHFSLFLQRGVLYFYFLEKPGEGCLKKPEENYGLKNVRNFYIQNENVTLGMWHILPDLYGTNVEWSDEEYEESLKAGHPIFVYVHGNVGSRARPDRLRLYQVLRSLNYHVISFDYRCFGDSTYSTPCENAVVSDAIAAAQWVISKAGTSPIFFYGHSLGTGMTTHAASQLSARGFEPHGIILEAPFDDMPSEIKVHPFGTIFRIFPWYNYLFSSPYYTNGETYDSANHILTFSSPVMILHAEDDGTIPSSLGEKLYSRVSAKRRNDQGTISIHIYDAKRGYGHTDLCMAPETPVLIRDFVNKHLMGRQLFRNDSSRFEEVTR